MTISVNEAIDRLDELNGHQVDISGVLSLTFEDYCISHTPQQEKHSDDIYGYKSSIWINYPELTEIINPTEEMLLKFNQRLVIVTGKLRKPEPGFSGCGHFSLWPAEIDVISITTL